VRLLFFFWAGLWSFSETLAAGKNMLHAQSQETAKDPSALPILEWDGTSDIWS
jgi:hypothetical protein